MQSCPICEEYEGTKAQVEAHISGKEDEAHTGMVGQNLVGEIVGEPVEIEADEKAQFSESDQPPSPGVPVALVVAVVIVVAVVFFVQYRMRSGAESHEATQGGVPYGT